MIFSSRTATFIPQILYQPRGETDREKYVYTAILSPPILFYAENSSELGIALDEIQTRRLRDKDDVVLQGCGRSISVRIEVCHEPCDLAVADWLELVDKQWPGYRSWNAQLLTRDYRNPPGPIIKAKLAINLARCIRRFMKVIVLPSSLAESFDNFSSVIFLENVDSPYRDRRWSCVENWRPSRSHKIRRSRSCQFAPCLPRKLAATVATLASGSGSVEQTRSPVIFGLSSLVVHIVGVGSIPFLRHSVKFSLDSFWCFHSPLSLSPWSHHCHRIPQSRCYSLRFLSLCFRTIFWPVDVVKELRLFIM